MSHGIFWKVIEYSNIAFDEESLEDEREMIRLSCPTWKTQVLVEGGERKRKGPAVASQQREDWQGEGNSNYCWDDGRDESACTIG